MTRPNGTERRRPHASSKKWPLRRAFAFEPALVRTAESYRDFGYRQSATYDEQTRAAYNVLLQNICKHLGPLAEPTKDAVFADVTMKEIGKRYGRYNDRSRASAVGMSFVRSGLIAVRSYLETPECKELLGRLGHSNVTGR